MPPSIADQTDEFDPNYLIVLKIVQCQIDRRKARAWLRIEIVAEPMAINQALG
jgi:hypothetical protein